jgi:hypothetical protein
MRRTAKSARSMNSMRCSINSETKETGWMR